MIFSGIYNMKQLYGICSFLVSVTVFLYGQEAKETQKIRIVNSSGTAKYWLKKDTKWNTITNKTQVSEGYTVKTQDKSELQFSIQPAITAMLGENSLLTFDKLLIDTAQKAIRMRHYFQQGRFEMKMPADMGYALLYTIITPGAHLFVNNADFKVLVEQNNTTRLEVYRGSVKMLHIDSENKSVVFSGSCAVASPGNPEITTSFLADAQIVQKKKAPPVSIAILSVYSKIVPRDNLEPLSDLIAQEIEKKESNTEVLFFDDVRKLLKAEGIQNLLNCATDSCIAKIGSFLGVDLVVIGNLGQIGNRYIFNMKMIDALRDKTKNRVSAVMDNDIGSIFNEIPNMVDSLVKGTIAPATDPDTACNDSIAGQRLLKEVVWISPGAFEMGSAAKEGEIDELPRHKVSLNGFYIDKAEVTKADFERVMGYNPSKFKGCQNCPADNVSWFEAQEYCSKVSKRLPTEAEWEYACRAGTHTPFHYGSILSSDQANFNGQKPFGNAQAGPIVGKPLPVASFKPNAWNLHDMHGNVWEWCSDWYDVAYYGNSDAKNPKGPKQGQYKVARGGSWDSDGAALRSANRISYSPSVRLQNLGFRCAKDAY